MQFDREAAVRRLNPVRAPYTSHFAGKAILIAPRPDVLDDGIAEDDIEGLVGEWEHAAIGADLIGRAVRYESAGKV